LLISHLGDSGRKKTKISWIPGMRHWRPVG